ncbi:olfactory receptor 6M1-like [Eublepharis macularius]|uniref:Olfactory receptor n=1 Tax=Eublepharis macularius TaxID=481883 RepID=A0AA97K4Z3_EUBMA|nr:olfactory receptor 6M1-like [Eublepharis macularius]
MIQRNDTSRTTVTEIVLLGFYSLQKLQLPLFLLFLIMYTLTLLANGVAILLIRLDRRLHTPMYYFLGNLFLLEILITTTVTPKMLSLLVSDHKTISFFGCAIQTMAYFLAGTAEVLLLAVMSVDRYVAICLPLRYSVLMSSKVCVLMVVSCWIIGLISIVVIAIFKAGLPFCGPNVIDHFFCDAGPMGDLICADVTFVRALELALCSFVLISSVSVTAVSYLCIIITVLRMPSAQNRQKAFGTCSSHIMVASLYYGSSIFIYAKPSAGSSMNFNKAATVLNTVVTPLLNPIIYSFRNKTVKEVMRQALGRMCHAMQKK